ncbi:hypothetical protein [Amycolatopsis panacis]|uniref:hypothetical protein n=1 Tax=Amycolatopsis panacis TaxID=2340917 RepID=UPI0011C497C0|nr:hypothetical protein [Amycolatopsis panacis]
MQRARYIGRLITDVLAADKLPIGGNSAFSLHHHPLGSNSSVPARAAQPTGFRHGTSPSCDAELPPDGDRDTTQACGTERRVVFFRQL